MVDHRAADRFWNRWLFPDRDYDKRLKELKKIWARPREWEPFFGGRKNENMTPEEEISELIIAYNGLVDEVYELRQRYANRLIWCYVWFALMIGYWMLAQFIYPKCVP